MKIPEAREKIAAHLTKNQTATPQEISYQQHVPLVQVFGILKHMTDLGIVEMEQKEKLKYYKILDRKKLDELLNEGKTPIVVSSSSPEKKEKKNTTGRDTTKYVFENQVLSKGQCALAVIKAVVRDKKCTLDELKSMFPDEIVPRFSVVRPLADIGDVSPDKDRPRYFIKEEQQVKVENTPCVITNQWTLERFLNFLAATKKAGYQVKPE